jgi:hypothetical protein
MPPPHVTLPVPHRRQPDDVSCGPACLAKVFTFLGCPLPWEELVASIERNPDGGTLGVYLGLTALRRGLRTTLYSYNLRVFDPTWARLDEGGLIAKLHARAENVADPTLASVTRSYARYLEAGGRMGFDELQPELLVTWLARGTPLVLGLSSTHLYDVARDDPGTNEPDDVAGEPTGHFVVAAGYRDRGARFILQDPYHENPFAPPGEPYEVDERRLLHAMLLGVLTYDGLILAIERPA